MTEALEETTTRISAEDLEAAGFTAREINALELLRDQCPYIEFFDSEIEMQRMRFLKWRFANGDFQEELENSSSAPSSDL